jgi:cholesterol transport system auxiliary component
MMRQGDAMTKTLLIGLMATLLLVGCISAPGRPAGAEGVFTLDADFPAKAAARRGPAILVALPRARAGFDGERMAYVRRPEEIEYYARHRWIDTPARMLAPLLVQALDSTGAFAAVLPAPTVARAGWRLETEVVRLQQSFTHQPSRVEFVLRAQLIEASTQQAVASQTFSATISAPSEDARGGAAAANAAVRQVLLQLAQWCAARTAAVPPGR